MPGLLTDTNSFLYKQNKPGLVHALILIAIAALISLVVGLFMQLMESLVPALEVWNMALSYILSFGLVLLIAKAWWQVPGFDIKKVSIIVYLLLVPLILALSILLEGVVSLIPMPEKIQRMFEQMLQLNFQGYLTLGIAAPLLEELIFRGVILKKFLERYNPAKAIIFSAMLFGLAHFNPWQFVPAFFVGIAIGWIYWKTQSVWPGIFIHFVNNSFSFYLAKRFEGVMVTFKDIIGNNLYYFSLLIICLLVVYAVYLVLGRFFKQQETKTI